MSARIRRHGCRISAGSDPRRLLTVRAMSSISTQAPPAPSRRSTTERDHDTQYANASPAAGLPSGDLRDGRGRRLMGGSGFCRAGNAARAASRHPAPR